jgi:hypothetical protein
MKLKDFISKDSVIMVLFLILSIFAVVHPAWWTAWGSMIGFAFLLIRYVVAKIWQYNFDRNKVLKFPWILR